jgi:plastocyanin
MAYGIFATSDLYHPKISLRNQHVRSGTLFAYFLKALDFRVAGGIIMKNIFRSLAFVSILTLLFSACAGLQRQVTVDHTTQERTVQMKASNFKFEPNNILTYRGDRINFEVENVSGTEHNFTITDPQGDVLQSVDIAAGKKVAIGVTFSEAGIYHFHCDEFLHSLFGMKGQVEVVERE